MKRRLSLPQEESAIRIRATTPDVNAWVAANAGSGKTSILRDRVIRLLLDGVPPDRILCLTFTRAAAAEMQSRIFGALAKWVSMSDDDLGAEIDRLTGAGAADATRRAKRLARARRLFAEAVETPGGLKIQTIHGFAERILHLFPIEAKVPVDFAVLDDGDARVLRDAARRSALEEATSAPDGALGRAFTTLVNAAGFDSYARAIDEALRNLAALRRRGPSMQEDPARRAKAYADLLGAKEAQTEAELEQALLAACPSGAEAHALAGSVQQIARTQGSAGLAQMFAGLADETPRSRKVSIILKHCLTQAGSIKKRDRFGKEIKDKRPDIAARASEMAEAALAHLDQVRRLRTLQRSRALDRFASAVLDRYESAKAARNLLDYNDLIETLRAMLLAGQAAWVMMKLDAAIDHILVDEAQDTTPRMWDIVKALSDDFFAGEGQARHFRSIFVVGDEKQSIFSFQGAEPRVFDDVRQHFSHQIRGAREDAVRIDHVTRPVRLTYSFRSSADILAAVDAVFASDEHRAGLSSDPDPPDHIAAHVGFPGLVELWPVEEPAPKAPSPEDADAPVDAPSPRHQSVVAAQRVAERIAHWLESGERHLSDGKPIRPGDIIILAQHRNPFFRAALRELKLRGVPVAGADRLKLQDEIVIHDLIGIAAAALLPEDDLVLATALKTPIFGVDEASLAKLCRHRPGSLRQQLMEVAEGDAALAAINARLAALEALARTATPFEFFADLLTQPCPTTPDASGRKAFLTRLGPDAADAIDAFVGEAIEYHRKGPAFLLPFITMMRARDTDIKRDLDQARGQVRVMTAHASKGLEARIVFVCDTLLVPSKSKESATLVADPDGQGLLLWAGAKREEPEAMAELRAAQRRKQFEEYRRLLYVAMTRAEERLYIVGHRIGTTPTPEKIAQRDPLEKSWYDLVSEGLAGRGEMHAFEREDGESVRRWVSSVTPSPPSIISDAAPSGEELLPGWLTSPLPDDAAAAVFLRPSRERQAPGLQALRDRQRGIAIHALYERLPEVVPEKRAVIGTILLAQLLPGVTADEAAALVNPVMQMLEAPGLREMFAPPSRAEVAVAGEIALPDGRRRPVSGRIDRVCVSAVRVDIVDIKSGVPRLASSDAEILRQMALYRALMQQIYPGREVLAHVLWAQSGRLETLAPGLLDAALAGITAQ